MKKELFKTKEKEIWKDIKGYEGYYQVSNLGKVRSLDRFINGNNCKRLKKGKILKPFVNNRGYELVILSLRQKTKHFQIHRLVAETFIPNPDNLPCVNHKDENPKNNKIDNLEWCTVKYNINYGTAIKRRVEKRSKPIIQYDKNFNIVAEWKSCTEPPKEKYDYSAITKCCKNIYKTHKGYIWRYKE